jgi:hypothetical protein
MIDRPTRTRLAEGLRHLVAGTMTNLVFDDILLEQAERSEDRGVREIAAQAWLLYDDFHVHRIEITDGARRDIARWILFLHSDCEFEWPKQPLGIVAWPVSLVDHLTGRRFRLYERAFRRVWGDFRYWPFFRKHDYDASLQTPKLLRGAA